MDDVLMYLMIAFGFSIFFWPYLIEKFTGKRFVAVNPRSNRQLTALRVNDELKREQLIATINVALVDPVILNSAMEKFNNSHYAKTILNLYTIVKDEYKAFKGGRLKEIDPYNFLTPEKQWAHRRDYALFLTIIETEYGRQLNDEQKKMILGALIQYEPS